MKKEKVFIAAVIAICLVMVFYAFHQQHTGAAENLKMAQGDRAISMAVPGHQLLYVKPGDCVDVNVTFEAKLKSGDFEKVTPTILQAIPVLNVYHPQKPEEMGVIQLKVSTPYQAQFAALSQVQGKLIAISLRAPGDTKAMPLEISSFRKLFAQ